MEDCVEDIKQTRILVQQHFLNKIKSDMKIYNDSKDAIMNLFNYFKMRKMDPILTFDFSTWSFQERTELPGGNSSSSNNFPNESLLKNEQP